MARLTLRDYARDAASIGDAEGAAFLNATAARLEALDAAPAPRVTGGLEVCDECGGWGEHMSTCSTYGGGVPDATRVMTARIVAERVRQQTDDRHTTGGLARAAACYALTASADGSPRMDDVMAWGERFWPWDYAAFKPSGDPMRDLERAGALILAEMERRART